MISKPTLFLNDDEGDGRRFYTDGKQVESYLKELNEEIFSPYGILTVGEMSSTSMAACIEYTKPANNELSMTFNFHHLKVDYRDGDKWQLMPMNISALKALLSDWQRGMQAKGGWNALFWCNHDQPRIVSRYGNDSDEYRELSAKMLALVLHGLQGTPYIYQGEEIGMTNPDWHAIDEFEDVETLNQFELIQQKGQTADEAFAAVSARSRDNGRTPVQWDASQQAGFTTGKPWLKIASNYTKINVAECLSRADSIFYFYQKLIALRKVEATLITGQFRRYDRPEEGVFAYDRIAGDEVIRVVANFTDQPVVFEWATPIHLAETLLTNYEGDATNDQTKLTLRPYESIMWKGTVVV